MRLLFLYVFIGLSGFAQKIDLGNLQGYQNSSLDTLTMEFHLYLDDQMITIDLSDFKKRVTPLTLEARLLQDEKYFVFPVLWVQGKPNFLYPSGGMVYTIDNDTLKRVDRSFDHNMQYGTAFFEHDHTIFKYGGYGFWSDRDFFTYYDKQRGEWEVYHPLKSDAIPEGRSFLEFIKNKNLFHIFGGKRVNPENRREQLDTNEAWTFDFKTNKWHFLGKHDKIEPFLKSIPFKNKLALVRKNAVTVIDVESNTKTVHKHSPVSGLTNGILYAAHAGDQFYMLIIDHNGTYLNIVKEEDFFGEVAEQTKFYKNQAYWLNWGAIYLLGMSLIILSFWLIKRNFVKRNKIKLLDNGLRYHLKFTEFDMESMAILKLLLSKPHVASNQILKIVEKEQYSPAHNERIKVQKINDINLKIATLLGTNKTIIHNFKAKNDRRIRVYQIDKQLFATQK